MKLITAIAALALLAGSMDVEAQLIGKRKSSSQTNVSSETSNKSSNTTNTTNVSQTSIPNDGHAVHPQFSPVAHLAIRAFSELDEEDVQDLVEAAEEGDEEALEELRAERVEAIESMIEALQDEDARKLIVVGMGLVIGANGSNSNWVHGGQPLVLPDGQAANLSDFDILLDGVEEQLEAQLNNYINFEM